MKYRRLNLDELKSLEKDFINFLAANSVTGEDWEKLKNEELDKAESLIEIFSDMVFDKTLEKIEYLEQKSAREIRTYHCQADKLIMIGLLIEGETTLDFRHNIAPEQMINQLNQSGAELKLFRGEKAYDTDRKEILFKLMEQGALIAKDGHLYKVFSQLQKA